MNGAEILTTIAQLRTAITAFNAHLGRLGDLEAFVGAPQ
jgi:hypothetical protein